jgi:hypothetical protein
MILRDVSLAGALAGLSDKIKAIRLNVGAAVLNDTTMGHSARVSAGGLQEWDGTITFKQDFTAAGLDDVIFALIGTTGTFSAKPTSAAVGTGNPNFTGTALFTGYAPLDGEVGALGETTLAFTSAGTLSRAVA